MALRRERRGRMQTPPPWARRPGLKRNKEARLREREGCKDPNPKKNKGRERDGDFRPREHDEEGVEILT